MMDHQTIDKLLELKLSGMAHAFQEQQANPAALSLSFEERFGLLVDSEATFRDNKRLQRLARNAKLDFPHAYVEDISYSPSRELDRSMMATLATCNWIKKGIHLMITGATGTGKTWIACTLANQAMRNGLSAHFVRISSVLEELAQSHAGGTFRSKLRKFAKFDLLIADDLGTQALDAQGRADFFELIVARADSKSTIVTSQLPFKIWHGFLSGGNKTTGDATMDRLDNSLKLVIKGESMRRMKGATTVEAPENRGDSDDSPAA